MDITGTFGWLFLPQLAAKLILRVVHWILLRISPRLVPHQNTPAYVRHQRASYVLVIALYLLYTMWNTERGLGANYYHLLGLSPGAFSESQLRRNFRQISLMLHPDKNPDGEQLFIQVQNAYKVLSNPVTRFVYDHGGIAAVTCQSCKSVSDYMLLAIPKRLGVYLAYVLGCVALKVFRIGKYGAYWQYVAIGTFAALEIIMMTGQNNPPAIGMLLDLVPHRTSFEVAQIMQQAMVCFFIALNQIGPQFIPQEKNVSTLDLAKELLNGIRSTNAEISGKAKRMANMFTDTGLKRVVAEEFTKELQLGMTLGTSQSFKEEFTRELNAKRSAIQKE